jgi:hypothetical protein
VQNTSRHTALRELVAALARAQRALAAGHEDDARAALTHALEIDPGNVQARDLLLQLDAGAGGEALAASGGASTKRSWPPEAPDESPERAATGQRATGWAAFEARVRARRAALESGAGSRVRERHDTGTGPRPAVTSWPPTVRSVSPPAFDEERSEPTATPTPPPITTIEPPRVRADEMRASRQAVMAPSSDQMVEGESVPPEIVWDAMTPATSHEPLPGLGPTLGASSRQSEDRERSRRLAMPALLVAVATIVAAAIGGVWMISPEEPASLTSEEQAAVKRPTTVGGAAPAETPPSEPPVNDDTADTAATSIPGGAGEAPQDQLEAVGAPSASVRNEERTPQVPGGSRPQLPPASPGARDNAQPERADSAASLESQPAPSSASLPEPAAPVSTMAGRRAPASAGAPGGGIEPAPSVPTASPIASGTPSPSTPVPPRPAPAEPSRAAATAAPGPDPVTGIRRALDDYARAYSERDAVAASQVWPAVDARALARAFDQLSEQSVTFSRCDIRPEGGDRAQASCTGRATWVPKVGDRSPREEARTWRFALTREGDEWVIEQVRF